MRYESLESVFFFLFPEEHSELSMQWVEIMSFQVGLNGFFFGLLFSFDVFEDAAGEKESI